jgi:imidazolonepropionase-like amidohydrolase
VGGLEIIEGDVLLHNGLVKGVGVITNLEAYKDIEEIDARGAWVTPG